MPRMNSHSPQNFMWTTQTHSSSVSWNERVNTLNGSIPVQVTRLNYEAMLRALYLSNLSLKDDFSSIYLFCIFGQSLKILLYAEKKVDPSLPRQYF